ncbi:transcription elongation factor SPT4 isoform X2 [Petaurus breviceps papuanus]|uniref:transcription elongation factor SPT4 isoform X2 n=1 Tax=Petaurus breviceps papuanus TaxID=3040969 RepID=UPI0036D93660
MALETVPKDLRHLRACLLCSLVKTIDQFEYDGCDNCDSYLQMKGNREMVYDCTSSSFDGYLQAWSLCSVSHWPPASRNCSGTEEPRCGLQIQRHSNKDLVNHEDIQPLSALDPYHC